MLLLLLLLLLLPLEASEVHGGYGGFPKEGLLGVHVVRVLVLSGDVREFLKSIATVVSGCTQCFGFWAPSLELCLDRVIWSSGQSPC